MKKCDAIQRMTIALAQNDARTATRLMIETRGISHLDYRRCAHRAEQIKRLMESGIPAGEALMRTA